MLVFSVMYALIASDPVKYKHFIFVGLLQKAVVVLTFFLGYVLLGVIGLIGFLLAVVTEGALGFCFYQNCTDVSNITVIVLFCCCGVCSVRQLLTLE